MRHAAKIFEDLTILGALALIAVYGRYWYERPHAPHPASDAQRSLAQTACANHGGLAYVVAYPDGSVQAQCYNGAVMDFKTIPM